MPEIKVNNISPLPSFSSADGKYTPTFDETFSAFFETETSVGALGNRVSRAFLDEPKQIGYDPRQDLVGYEEYAQEASGLDNPMDVYYFKKDIDNMQKARDVISSSSGVTSLAAMMASQAFDPLNYLPAFGLNKASSALTAIQKIGLGAGATASSAAVQETALYALNPARTEEEITYGIAGASIIGGALGAATGGLLTGQLAKMGENTEKAFKVLQSKDSFEQVSGEYKSAGAAASRVFTKEGQQLSGALGAEKLFSFNDPVIRTLSSPSVKTQEISERLATTSLLKEKFKTGDASHIPVELRIEAHDSVKIQYQKGIDDIYSKYKAASKERGEKPLSYGEFGVEVTKANRRLDQSSIPEVAEAASFVRKTVYDPYLKMADETGLMKKDDIQLKTAPSYAPRSWNREKIQAENATWTEKNMEYLRTRRDAQAAELDSLSQGKLDKKIQEINAKFENQVKIIKQAESRKEKAGAMASRDIKALRVKTDNEILALKEKFAKLNKRVVEDDYLEDVVSTLTQRIEGTPYGRLKYDMNADHDMPSHFKKQEKIRGPMKARVYDIPDENIEDFLVNDLDHLVNSHIRTMSRDIEVYKEFGTLEPDGIMKEIKDDYDVLKRGKNDKEVAKLNKKMKRDMKDVGYMFERLRGIDSTVSPDYYGSTLGKAERMAMKFNYVRLLGGMTLSALPDLARIVMAKGMGPLLSDGLGLLAKDFKKYKGATNELAEAGIGADMVLGGRIRSIMGVDDYAPPIGKAEQYLAKAGQVFGNVSLMNPWNATMRQFSGVVIQSQMLKASKALAEGAATPKQIRDLASSFIDKDMAKRIASQLNKHGDVAQDAWLSNSKLWDDKAARDTLMIAIRKEVDNVIITPGLARSIWLTKPGLRVVGQFRSFGSASMQKALISGLQRRDMETLNGLAIAVALGATSRIMKSKISGYPLSDDPAKLILEGIDASGVTGWLMDANNILEKTTAGRIGLNPLIGQAPMSRYASRSALSSIVGPTYGLVGDSLNLSSAAFSGEWRAGDSHTLRQLLPFNNVFWFRGIVDKLESNTNKALGVAEPKKASK